MVQSFTAWPWPGTTIVSYWLKRIVKAWPSSLIDASQEPEGQPVPSAVTAAKYAPLGFGTLTPRAPAVSPSSSPESADSAAQPEAPTQATRATSETAREEKSFMT